jgi:hypothetical protein
VTPEQRETAKRAILDKYARFGRNGPMVCWPKRDDPTGRHSIGKVMFQDCDAAEAAALELAAIYGGDPQAVYVCPRSRSGHAHLTGRRDGGATG